MTDTTASPEKGPTETDRSTDRYHVVCHECDDCEAVTDDVGAALERRHAHELATGHDVAFAEVRAR
jgi:hypothetical protein